MNHQAGSKTFLPVFLTALILSITFSLFLSVHLYPEDKSAGKTIRIKLQFLHNREYRTSISRTSPPAYPALVRFSVARLFNRKYYPYARIVERNNADYTFTVEIAEDPGKYTITTTLTAQDNQSPGHNKIISTIPYLSPASGISAAPSLVPAVTGDIFYLFAQTGDFRFTALSSPPYLRTVLHTNVLHQITGWTSEELQPLDISNYRGGLLLTMAGGFLTLGNSLQITGGTVRDISYQRKNRISFLPLTASSDLLGNITVISQNADSFETIKFDRTRRIIGKNGLRSQGAGNFLYAGFYSGGFALIDQSTGTDKRISFYTRTAAAASYMKSAPGMVPPAVKTYPLHSSYISAAASDYGGNLWLYDSMEKRIRIVNQQGSEISSVKPIIRPALLLFPQLLKICSDGSFMLGGSGILVKFDSAGIPIWTIREYQLNGTRALPAFFRIACSEKDLSFFLLDIQSRQILKFREYSGQSGRNNLRLVKSDEAVLFDTELLPSDKKKLARITEKAGRYYEDELEPHFAETFYNRSLKLFRSIRKKDPVDPDAPLKIEELIRARNRNTDYLVPDHTIAVSLSPNIFYTSAGLYYREKDALKVRISNLTGDPVNSISLRIYIPGFSSGIAEITVKQLSPYRTREISTALPLKRTTESLKINTENSLNILLSFTVHNKTKKSYLSFPVYMAGRNTLRDISGITRFYMPKARIISELKSSFTDYLNLYLPDTVKGGSVLTYRRKYVPKSGHVPAERRKYTQPADSRSNGIAFSSLIDAVLKIDKQRSGKGRSSAFPLPGITEPPVYLSADNTTSLATLIFLASIAGNFGYKPFLLSNSNRIILCIDTGIPIDRLDKTGKYSAVIRDISSFLLKEKIPSGTVLPLYTAFFKEKAVRDLNSPNRTEPEPTEENTEESPQHTYFQDLQNAVIRQLEQIAGMGIQSYKRLQLKENPVPAVYPGIYGENYLPDLGAAGRSFFGQNLSKRRTSITGDFNKLLNNIGIPDKEK